MSKRVTITTIRKALRAVESNLDTTRSGDALNVYGEPDDLERAAIIFQQVREWLRANGYAVATSVITRPHMVVFRWNVRWTHTDELVAANID